VQRHLVDQTEVEREVTHACTVAQTPAADTVAEMFTFACYPGVVEEHRVPAARPTAAPESTDAAAWVWPQDLHRMIGDGVMLDLVLATRDAAVQGRGGLVRPRRQAPLLTLPTVSRPSGDRT